MIARFMIGFCLIASASALSGCTTGDCDPLESCDIRDHSCQEKVAKVVACLRDSSAVTPRVDVVDADDFIDAQVKNAEDDPLSDDQRAQYKALNLLALMPKDAEASDLAADEWANVAAFYDSETRRVTVLDRGYELEGPGAVLLLVHELVHAQQARETDGDFYPASDDSRDAHWAANALVEGEAALYQDLAETFAYGVEPGELDWKKIYRNYESNSWFYASGEPAIYERVDDYFSYAFGGAYLSAAYAKGGTAAVRKAVKDVPASTRELGAGYPRKADRYAVESLDDVAVPMLPDSYTLVSLDRVGSFLFESFVVRAESRLRVLPDLVGSGVTGDSLSTFRAGDDAVAVFWRVRFEDADHAQAFEGRLTRAKSDWVVKRDDRDLIVAAVSDDGLKADISGDLTWGAAPDAEMDSDDSPIAVKLSHAAFPRHCTQFPEPVRRGLR